MIRFRLNIFEKTFQFWKDNYIGDVVDFPVCHTGEPIVHICPFLGDTRLDHLVKLEFINLQIQVSSGVMS